VDRVFAVPAGVSPIKPHSDALRGWMLVAPALLWTLAFFLLPLVIMAV
jgi:ABC-type sugar transport system permease subunit